MTNHEQFSCPFSKSSSKNLKKRIQLEKPNYSVIKSFFLHLKEYLSRIGFESIRNSWLSYSLADLNTVFSRTFKLDYILSEFKTPIGTQYIIKDPALLQYVLSHFRNEEKGLLHVPENKKIFIDGLVKDLYPEEMEKITDIEREVVNAMIFTAESEYIPALRSKVMSFLKQKSVLEYRDQLDAIAGDILDHLNPEEKDKCNSALLVFEFAITVICKLFIGYNAERKQYKEIVSSMVTISDYISNTITHRPLDQENKKKYFDAIKKMKGLIEHHMADEESSILIKGLREGGFSTFAIKLYLFFFYIAGTETTSAVTHFLVLQLGRKKNKNFQQVIRNEGKDSIFLKKCVAEALRLNPPVFIIGRTLRENRLLTVRDENEKIIWSKLLFKDHHLVCWVAGAGKDPKTFENPEEFNPDRFDTIPTQYSWFPFTTGPHTCPGQFLAKAEMESLVNEFLKRFEISNDPYEADIETKGAFTLHADPLGKIKIKLTPICNQPKMSELSNFSKEEVAQWATSLKS